MTIELLTTLILWVSILVLVTAFIIYLYRLVSGTSTIRRCISELVNSEIEVDPLGLAMRDIPFLESSWISYEENLYPDDNDRVITADRASTHFGTGLIKSKAMNMRSIMGAQSLLIGGGILGTFLGLAVGLQSIEIAAIDLESIAPLIAGMKTAFWSSVAGMFLSIVFSITEKVRFKSVDSTIRDLWKRLDDSFFATLAERHRLERESQIQLFSEVFGYSDQSGNQVLPGHVLRDLSRDASEQTAALKSFSSDLADGIKISTSSLDELQESLGNILRPTLEKMNDSANSGIESALDTWMEKIDEGLSGKTVDKLDLVADTISETSESLKGLPEILKNMQSVLQDGIIDSTIKMNEEMEISLAAFRGEVQQLATGMSEVIGTASEETNRLITREGERIEETGELVGKMNAALNSASETVSRAGTAAEQIGKAGKKMEGVVSKLSNSSSRFQEISENLDKTSAQMREGGSALITGIKDSTERLNSSVDATRKMIEDATMRLKTVEGGLASIFKQIQTGLTDYRDGTKESLNKYLVEFSDQLSTAADSLSSTVKALDDSISDISDSLEEVASKMDGQRRASSPRVN